MPPSALVLQQPTLVDIAPDDKIRNEMYDFLLEEVWIVGLLLVERVGSFPGACI